MRQAYVRIASAKARPGIGCRLRTATAQTLAVLLSMGVPGPHSPTGFPGASCMSNLTGFIRLPSPRRRWRRPPRVLPAGKAGDPASVRLWHSECLSPSIQREERQAARCSVRLLERVPHQPKKFFATDRVTRNGGMGEERAMFPPRSLRSQWVNVSQGGTP